MGPIKPKNYRSILTNQLISRSSSVARFQLYRELGKGIEKGKSLLAIGWPGVIGKGGAIFLQLFQPVSDRSLVSFPRLSHKKQDQRRSSAKRLEPLKISKWNAQFPQGNFV